MSIHNARTDRIAYWAALAAALLAVGGGFLIAASQTSCSAWATFFVIAGVGAILGSVYLFGALFVGRGLPDMGDVRRTKKLEREHEARLARYALRDALQEFLDELDNNARDLGIQLANERTYGIFHPANAWAKNRHVLRDHPETRELVRDAYQRTHALDQRTQERYDAASHDDVNDPEWKRLTENETRERTEALEAVQKARTAVQAVLGET